MPPIVARLPSGMRRFGLSGDGQRQARRGDRFLASLLRGESCFAYRGAGGSCGWEGGAQCGLELRERGASPDAAATRNVVLLPEVRW